ncbi:hypothetical protein TYRP_002704 [Tyrophagus putrescentiae]|nr:hypothetical protein TYRP_002704 [Tyrophagus putrescentiae]
MAVAASCSVVSLSRATRADWTSSPNLHVALPTRWRMGSNCSTRSDLVSSSVCRLRAVHLSAYASFCSSCPLVVASWRTRSSISRFFSSRQLSRSVFAEASCSISLAVIEVAMEASLHSTGCGCGSGSGCSTSRLPVRLWMGEEAQSTILMTTFAEEEDEEDEDDRDGRSATPAWKFLRQVGHAGEEELEEVLVELRREGRPLADLGVNYLARHQRDAPRPLVKARGEGPPAQHLHDGGQVELRREVQVRQDFHLLAKLLQLQPVEDEHLVGLRQQLLNVDDPPKAMVEVSGEFVLRREDAALDAQQLLVLLQHRLQRLLLRVAEVREDADVAELRGAGAVLAEALREDALIFEQLLRVEHQLVEGGQAVLQTANLLHVAVGALADRRVDAALQLLQLLRIKGVQLIEAVELVQRVFRVFELNPVQEGHGRIMVALCNIVVELFHFDGLASKGLDDVLEVGHHGGPALLLVVLIAHQQGAVAVELLVHLVQLMGHLGSAGDRIEVGLHLQAAQHPLLDVLVNVVRRIVGIGEHGQRVRGLAEEKDRTGVRSSGAVLTDAIIQVEALSAADQQNLTLHGNLMLLADGCLEVLHSTMEQKGSNVFTL